MTGEDDHVPPAGSESPPTPRPTLLGSLRTERERLLRHVVNVELARHDVEHRSSCLPQLPPTRSRLLYYEAVWRVAPGRRQPLLLAALCEAYVEEDEDELREILGSLLADEQGLIENAEHTRLCLTAQVARLRLHLNEVESEARGRYPRLGTRRG